MATRFPADGGGARAFHAPPGFSRMIERSAVAADLGIKTHATCSGMPVATSSPTMVMTRAIQAYLGHRNIQNTTAQRPRR